MNIRSISAKERALLSIASHISYLDAGQMAQPSDEYGIATAFLASGSAIMAVIRWFEAVAPATLHPGDIRSPRDIIGNRNSKLENALYLKINIAYVASDSTATKVATLQIFP